MQSEVLSGGPGNVLEHMMHHMHMMRNIFSHHAPLLASDQSSLLACPLQVPENILEDMINRMLHAWGSLEWNKHQSYFLVVLGNQLFGPGQGALGNEE